MIFAKRFRYRFGDIDRAGIAYYPKLLHYFHCCFEDWWSEGLGYSYAEWMRADKLGMPTVRLEVDFIAPVRYGDEPTVHLGVLRLGEASVEFGFWMTGATSQQVLCRARITNVVVDMDTMQKRPLPDAWRQRFLGYQLPEAEFPPGRAGKGRNSRGK